TSSSLYLPIAVSSFSDGITPASLFLVALTITITFMVLLLGFEVRFGVSSPGSVPGSDFATNKVGEVRLGRTDSLGGPVGQDRQAGARERLRAAPVRLSSAGTRRRRPPRHRRRRTKRSSTGTAPPPRSPRGSRSARASHAARPAPRSP